MSKEDRIIGKDIHCYDCRHDGVRDRKTQKCLKGINGTNGCSIWEAKENNTNKLDKAIEVLKEKQQYENQHDFLTNLMIRELEAIEILIADHDRLQKENSFLKSKIEDVKNFCVIGMQSLENKAKESEYNEK